MTSATQQRPPGAEMTHPPAPASPGAGGWAALIVLGVGLLAAVAVLGVVHVTQGTAGIAPGDVLRVVLGDGSDQETAIVLQSRLPRLLAAVLVGVALGVAGSVLQSVARNPLASPDTLAVEAGAYLALTVVAAFSISLPVLSSAGVAFAGGLLTAAVVLGLTGGFASSTLRVILAGTVVAFAMGSVTAALLIIFSQETRGLYAWGAGSLTQRDLDGVATMAPVIAVAVVAALLLARRLDVLELGDDVARSLGVAVARSRLTFVVIAVLLSAAAVTVAGPIGFIGLSAPAAMRLLDRRVPALRRSRWRIPASALAGVVTLLAADVVVRALLGAEAGVEVPTGVVTTIVGAVFLVVLAQRVRDSSAGDEEQLVAALPWGRRHFRVVLIGGIALLAVAVVAGLLLGDTPLRLGDLTNVLTGQASGRIQLIVETRTPRVVAAALAGTCLALAGAIVQGVTRNPLADPGILGVAAGAGLGAILTLTFVPGAGFGLILLVAGAFALAAGALILAMSGRSLDQARLILVGIGVSAGAASLTTLVIVRSDPWNQAKAITWLGGSTYGAVLWQQVPMAVVLVVGAAVLLQRHRELDLVQLDEATPRLLGVRLERARAVVLLLAVAFTAVATASIGVIVFAGLIAPHAARLLVGRSHAQLLPTTAILGAVLVIVADLIGRTVLAPSQLPAGLVTALLGAPYFLWLMSRTRVRP